MTFEHVANSLALELANSIPVQGESADWLAEPGSVAAWADSLGLPLDRPLDADDRARLAHLRRAITLVFGAIAAGRTADAADLRSIAQAHAAGLEEYGFTATGTSVRRDWPGTWTVSALLALFADSAVAELTGERLERVKECPSCGWLFVDTSRNRSRRWCSMEMCGNRDKAYRHYHRGRDGAEGPAGA